MRLLKKHFKKYLTLFLFSAIIFSLSSCRSSRLNQHKVLRPVYITNHKKINLLPAENAALLLDKFQMFNGTFGDTTFSLLSYTQIDSTGISLSLLNDFGTDMGNLYFNGEELTFESAYIPSKLPGEYIVAEIQNAYYDEAELKKNYQSAGLRFDVESDPEQKVQLRKLYDGKKLIEEIQIFKNTVRINNYLRGYSFELVDAE